MCLLCAESAAGSAQVRILHLLALLEEPEALPTALAGGISAEEEVARRDVSLGTVRTQIRSILAKSGAINLRDLERRLASLAALTPGPAGEQRR